MSQTLSKLASRDLAGVLPQLALGKEATAALEGCRAAREALDRLQTTGHLAEAARLIAHALPKREAVWWACMCALHTAPADLPAKDLLAREAAEDWVRQQNEHARRTAWDRAQDSGCGTPEAWAAVAAFWSGDSLSPEGQPVVPPAPHLAARAVAGAVALAAVRGDAGRRHVRFRRFLESGRNIATGGPGRLPAETA